MNVFKGIFWYFPNDHCLITVKVACDENGNALETVSYTSKSGDNFNHKTEWAKMPKSVTGGYPYNYYPRGRVEIQKKKATIFFNPVLDRFDIQNLILQEFGLMSSITVRKITDGSRHYEYLADF